MKNVLVKYRVEEHFKNSNNYYLHGSYDNIASARNKIKNLIKNDKCIEERLFIVKKTLIEFLELVK